MGTNWRYENPGTADLLSISGTTLTDLPETKSVTGTAFYQTTFAKCFDLPATAEVWMKFDVYFNGSHRWRAYNGGSNGVAGITAAGTSGRLVFFVNDIDKAHFDKICKTNQLQTVLLHMISGSSDGIVEAWVDGTKIHTYTGDVNHGQDFGDIFLQSDGSGTFFSNVIISPNEIGLNENVGSQTGENVELLFDVQRKVKNNAEVSFDTQRLLTRGVNLLADSQRQIFRSTELLNDVERIVANTITFDVELSADVQRKLANNVQASFDSQRQLFYGAEVVADTQRQVFRSVNLIADTDRQLVRSVELLTDVERFFRWRYENAGTADSLITSGTTLTGLSIDKSVTGTAFYQTTQAKCFDLPATPEVWMKFDVYFNSSHRWRAYNGGSNGVAGITAQTDGRLGFFVNSTDKGHFDKICKTNQLRTVLLHMVSGSSDGIIEAWVDGTKIYTYTGDVNHGDDFEDLYLQSDGSGTFFSNVIISNVEIKLGEGWHASISDVESQVINFAELVADTERIIRKQGSFEFSFDTQVDVQRSLDLPADVQRNVQLSLDLDYDLEVFSAVPVQVLLDAKRSIVTHINLNAIPEPQVAPLHMLKAPVLRGEWDDGEGGGETIRAIPNTPGLQSLELNIAVGQLSSRLKFTSTDDIPVLGAVTGRYLDYSYRMGVTRKSMSKSRSRPSDDGMPQASQNSAAYFTYDCWYDITAMLYTQINYTIDENDDEDDAEVFDVQVDSGSKTVYLTPTGSGEYTQAGEVSSEGSVKKRSTAKGHLSYIAKALGLKPETAFQDFIVDLELEQVDVTPADLISKIFGWTARIPNRLISVFPAEINGELCLCVVQRGFKASEGGGRDISREKQSVARIEQKLVRTLWGSSVKSSTYTVETHHGGLYVLLPPPAASPDGRTTYTYSEVNGGYLLATSTTQNDDGSVTTVNYEYSEVDGVYTCALEDAITRDEEGEIIGRTYTSHHILTPSQQLSRMFDEDGNLIATAVSSHLPGLYERKQTLLAPRVEVKENDLPAIPLLDTSFPIIDGALVDTGDDSSKDEEDKMLTFAVLADCIKKLNLATQETVRLDIYDCEHVLNVNDDKVIVWDGNQYFLESNTAIANQHIANKQSLTLVRWIPYVGNGD